MPTKDYRAKIHPISSLANFRLLGRKDDRNNILAPLYKTGGVLFPYTPMIQVQHATVNYGQYDLAHTNYDYMAYQRTSSPSATVTGVFGAHTQEEAEYMMAVIHFFRTVTKSAFGGIVSDPFDLQDRGTPPPKLAFSAYGDTMFNKTPIYIRTVAFGLDQDVDYVPVRNASSTGNANYGTLNRQLENSYVPLVLNIFVDIVVAPNPSKLRDEFNLKDFRSGKLLDKGYY
tara:strand:- start:4687 stop:5373 length:687 start_codon:yes stop_codon:yes gene_type:complete